MSALEAAVRADDGQVGEVQPAVVGGAVAQLHAAQIPLSQFNQR